MARAITLLTLLLLVGGATFLLLPSDRPEPAASAPVTSERQLAGLELELSRTLTRPVMRNPSKPAGYVQGQVLVRFRAGATPERRKDILADIGATTARVFNRPAGLELVRLPTGVSVAQALNYFAGLAEVDGSEPDYLIYKHVIPDDTFFDELWGLNNTGQAGGAIDVDMNAPEAWDITTGNDEIVIGVIDTGIDYNHVDLAPNMWVNPGEVANNGIDDDGNGYVDDIHGIDAFYNDSDPSDDDGHGTHVAGTIAARGNNGTGITGVMWNARLVGCKFIGDQGFGTTSAALECLEYFGALKQAGVNVVATNNSWGSDEYSQLLYDAIAEHGQLGILFVAAAGNLGLNIDFGGEYPGGFDLDTIITVAAINQGGTRAAFSNYGPVSVDVAAPGVEIYSTRPGNRYAYASGTSMAVPHVAGLIGLLNAVDLGLTPAEIKERILTTGVVVPSLVDKTVSGMRVRIDLPPEDSDLDGMADSWEVDNGFSPSDPGDAQLDADEDGLINLDEFLAGTDPRAADSDNDGLNDGDEVNVYMTLPLFPDTDLDGLSDGDEVNVHLTDPTLADTDADGLTDDEELQLTTDPLSADSDNDGQPDGWEVEFGLDPLDATDAGGDTDNDGLVNSDEYLNGTNPNDSDSDNDGLNDDAEVTVHGTDPNDDDSDDDGIDDGWEIQYSMDPLDASDAGLDFDNDGFSNLTEFRGGSDPTNPSSLPALQPWVTWQGNAQHTGHVTVTTDAADFAERWQVSIDQDLYGRVVVAADQIIVATRSNSSWDIRSLRLGAGSERWRRDLVDGAVLGTPVMDDNGAYYVAGRYGIGAALNSLDLGDGSIRYSAGMPATDTTIVPYDGRLYVRDVDFLASYDAATGQQLWRSQVAENNRDYDDWVPAVNDDHAVVFADGTLSVFDRITGEPVSTIEYQGCSSSSAGVVLDAEGNAIVRYGSCLIRFDLTTGQTLWSTSGAASDPLTTDDNSVYYATAGRVIALDLSDGTERWQWDSQGSISSNLVSTQNHLFVVSSSRLNALDLNSGQAVWELANVRGSLALTDLGTLVVKDTLRDTITTIDILGDTDQDGLPDWWERLYRLDYLDPSDAGADNDGDGLANLGEFAADTDPTDNDTDDDGLNDGAEINAGTDPLDVDTDGDGLTDGAEVNVHGSNPLDTDTDADGFPDGDEVNGYRTDPTDPDSTPVLVTDYHESFENGFPSGWINGVDADSGWAVTSSDATDGQFSLAVSGLGRYESAAVEWTDTFTAGDLSFEFRGTGDGPRPNFFLDGRRIEDYWQGDWWRVLVRIPQGLHTLRWEFTNGSSEAPGEVGWLDNVRFVVPKPFAYIERNILGTNDGSLVEWTPEGRLARAPVPIPDGVYASDLIVTPDHEIVIAAGEQLHFVDPITMEFRRVDISEYGLVYALTMHDDYLLGAAYSGGILRFDSDAQFVDSAIPNTRYLDISMGADGLLYAVRRDFSYGQVEVIDPDSLDIIRRVDLTLGIKKSVAADANGFVYTGSSSYIEKFTADGEQIGSVRAPRNIDLDFTAEGLLAWGAQINAGVVTAGLEPLDSPPLGRWNYVARILRTGSDTDNDGMPDWWEQYHGLDFNDAADATLDIDGDQLDNAGEFLANSEPADADSDDDRLSDADEYYTHGTYTTVADSDGDGIDDGDEVLDFGTSPLLVDTDGDGLSDANEIQSLGSDPLSIDTDSDGMDDGWEFANGLDLLDSGDASADTDNDGLSNLGEFLNDTDIGEADTDGDNLLDGDEVHAHLTDPVLRDSDNDRLSDGWEVQFGLDPLMPDDALLDSDADSFTNVEEYYSDTDPLDVASYPIPAPWATHQGDAQHRGYVPLRIDADNLREMWTTTVSSSLLNQVAARRGHVFVTASANCGSDSIRSYSSLTGVLRWEREVGDCDRLGPPAIDDRFVYLRVRSSRPVFLGLDLDDGAEMIRRTGNSLIGLYLAPVPYDGDVYYVSGYRGGIARFDVDSQSLLWGHQFDTDFSYSRWSPAVDESFVYSFRGTGGHLTAIDRETGDPVFSIDDGIGGETGPSPIVGQGKIFAIQDTHLLGFDPRQRSLQIDRNGGYTYTRPPALANGILYVVASNAVVALDDRDGAELWRWTAPGLLTGNVVATLSHAFVSSPTVVYAIDLETRTSVWTLPRAGQLSLDDGGVLFIAGYEGDLTAVATYLDADLDALPDTWETQVGLDPGDAADAAADPDGDGLNNTDEYVLGTRVDVADTDGDGLNDGAEVNEYDSDPFATDTDGDTLSDGDEVNLYNSSPTSTDTDGDGLTDGDEVNIYLTDPVSDDGDADGFADPFELGRGSDPNDAASTPDPIGAMVESFETGALPLYWRNGPGDSFGWQIVAGNATDGTMSMRSGEIERLESSVVEWNDMFKPAYLSFDVSAVAGHDRFTFTVDGELVTELSVSDWQRVEVFLTAGWHTLHWTYNDNTYGDTSGEDAFVDLVRLEPFDADEDLMPDRWELQYGFNPADSSDAAADLDSDDLTNLQEYELETEPNDSDSDDDGMPDGWEVSNGLDPLQLDAGGDPDDDGADNLDEFDAGTDPGDSDSEDDGMPDGWEMNNGLDPLTDDAGQDPDNDGVSNLNEFLAGTDPHAAPPPAPVPPPPPSNSGGGGGGGAVDPVLVLGLCVVLGLALRRRKPARG